MKEFCENSLCENPGLKEVPVSVNKPSDQVRTVCAPCEEAYTWGVQHGSMRSRKACLWTVAVADRGVIEHVQTFPTRVMAQKGLAGYLRRYHDYAGSHKMEELNAWLEQHDERISAQIMCQRLNLGIDSAASRRLTPGLLISPPSEECVAGEKLHCVVYSIEVCASGPREAAELTYHIMTDPDSMRPALEVIDPKGSVTTIDLSEEKGEDKP